MLEMIEQIEEEAQSQLLDQIEKAYIRGSKDGKNQAQELIKDAYKRGFSAGYSKAENDYYAKTESDRQSSYELGLNVAWESAKKISSMESYKLYDIFGDGWFWNIFNKFSASEIIAKIKAYEEQKKQEEDNEIHVGDEVYILDQNYHSVVTCIFNNIAVCITQNGKWNVEDLDKLHKTGRHFPEIAEVLKKMKEGDCN